MAKPSEIKRYFKKRGFAVGEVEQMESGLSMQINYPDEAKRLYDSLLESRINHITFVKYTPPVLPINVVFASATPHKLSLWQRVKNWFKRRK